MSNNSVSLDFPLSPQRVALVNYRYIIDYYEVSIIKKIIYIYKKNKKNKKS